ncbi:MAG: DUF433 domain-containing protein [Burkholderiales bacterium]
MNKPLITCSPDVMGGAPVFAGTRVPIQTLLDCLEGGETIDDLLDGFPTVTREQVVAFIEEAKARMVASALGAPQRCVGRQLARVKLAAAAQPKIYNTYSLVVRNADSA